MVFEFAFANKTMFKLLFTEIMLINL